VFRDEDIFVVEKPPAMHSVYNENSRNEESLQKELEQLYSGLKLVTDAGLVQRLDFETTGLIAGAFNEASRARLKLALISAEFLKSYLVLVQGACTQRTTVQGYLGGRYRGSAKVTMKDKPFERAQHSISEIFPLQVLGNCSLVRVDCSLARRHQVRVHMASIDHPLVGDALYGATLNLADFGVNDYPSDFILVAYTLKFSHPITKETVSFKSSFDTEMFLKTLKGQRAAV